MARTSFLPLSASCMAWPIVVRKGMLTLEHAITKPDFAFTCGNISEPCRTMTTLVAMYAAEQIACKAQQVRGLYL